MTVSTARTTSEDPAFRALVGERQAEAIHLYEKLGFTRIPLFGPYVNLPASICMQKPISA